MFKNQIILMKVREVIAGLSYDLLVREKLIPDILKSFQVETKKYSPFVYKTKNFSFFGMLMDYWVRGGFMSLPELQIDLGIEPGDGLANPDDINVYRSSKNVSNFVLAVLRIVRSLMNSPGFSDEDVVTYIPTLTNLVKELNASWKSSLKILGTMVKYNAELSMGENLTGHPDIMTETTVLDIKTTSSFKSIGKESCLQILAYYAMCPDSITYCGIVFPLQRQVKIIDLIDWDCGSFKELLMSKSLSHQPETIELVPDLVSIYAVGFHVAKNKSYYQTIKSFVQKTGTVNTDRNTVNSPPIQMFLRNTRNGKQCKATSGELFQTGMYIASSQVKFFTHAPYIINLCADATDESGVKWARNLLREDLVQTKELCGKGVVVHTGAMGKRRIEDALDTMETMIRDALKEATINCRLLLETPCGEGTEVCSIVEDMAAFFQRFNSDEQKLLALCVDTAHVHAAGYNPLTYLNTWTRLSKIPIALVHFNDSKVCCGSCVDRHAYPGTGKIGFHSMFDVAEWCTKHQVPMIYE